MFFSEGAALVRVADMETNKRMLIRELKKDVKDLAFAYTRPEVVLGAVDGNGTTHVFNILRTKEGIQYPFTTKSDTYEEYLSVKLRCGYYVFFW